MQEALQLSWNSFSFHVVLRIHLDNCNNPFFCPQNFQRSWVWVVPIQSSILLEGSPSFFEICYLFSAASRHLHIVSSKQYAHIFNFLTVTPVTAVCADNFHLSRSWYPSPFFCAVAEGWGWGWEILNNISASVYLCSVCLLCNVVLYAYVLYLWL